MDKRFETFLPGTWSALPIAVGDQLALDFLNSVAAPNGERIDWVVNGYDLLNWLRLFGAIDETELDDVATKWSADMLNEVAKEAVVWREQLRDLVKRISDKGRNAVDTRDVQAINRWLAGDRIANRLNLCDDGTTVLSSRRIWSEPEQLLTPVAFAAAEMIVSGDWSNIRKCENPACTIWFQDRTKGHRRRWCSQALCGNRFKVAAYRERQKASP